MHLIIFKDVGGLAVADDQDLLEYLLVGQSHLHLLA